MFYRNDIQFKNCSMKSIEKLINKKKLNFIKSTPKSTKKLNDLRN